MEGLAVRKAKLVGVALLTFLLVASGASAYLRRPQVTLESYQRIDAGMTVPEVVAILGRPRDYATGPTSDAGSQESVMYHSEFQHGAGERLTWTTDNATIAVSFESRGQTYCKEFWRSRREEQTPFQNMCWLAHRQWRRWFPENIAQTGYIRPQPPEF
jgi:hypothetical protein